MITLNDIEPAALFKQSYYSRLTWPQFCSLYVQVVLRLDKALDHAGKMSAQYGERSGKAIDAHINLGIADGAWEAMDAYLRTEVPHWMAEEARELAQQALG